MDQSLGQDPQCYSTIILPSVAWGENFRFWGGEFPILGGEMPTSETATMIILQILGGDFKFWGGISPLPEMAGINTALRSSAAYISCDPIIRGLCVPRKTSPVERWLWNAMEDVKVAMAPVCDKCTIINSDVSSLNYAPPEPQFMQDVTFDPRGRNERGVTPRDPWWFDYLEELRI